MQCIVFAKKFEINKRWTEKVEISVSILSLVRSGFFWCVEVEAQDKNQITRQLTHEKVEAWMTRCTFPHLSFWMQKHFYYCEISRVILLLQLQQLILQKEEGSGGLQGDSQQFGWFANKAGLWDFVTSKMQRTSQITKNRVKMCPAPREYRPGNHVKIEQNPWFASWGR